MIQSAITNIRNSSFPIRHSSLSLLFLIVLFIIISACDNKDQNKAPSLTTKGELTIGVDESLRPFIEAEIEMFSVYYPESSITPLYLSEKNVIEKLINNEIQTGIICRNLMKEEVDVIESNFGHKVNSYNLGFEKIVAVVNKSNPLKSISSSDLTGIISGNFSSWNELERSFHNEEPIIAVIPAASNIDRYFFSNGNLFPPDSLHALDTTTEVLDYVKGNNSAIGIVGGSWLYASEAKTSDIRILNYSEDSLRPGNEFKDLFFEVYAVTHEPFTGLGNGFISFIMGQKGQLILSKAGMIPYKPIEREVNISDSF